MDGFLLILVCVIFFSWWKPRLGDVLSKTKDIWSITGAKRVRFISYREVEYLIGSSGWLIDDFVSFQDWIWHLESFGRLKWTIRTLGSTWIFWNLMDQISKERKKNQSWELNLKDQSAKFGSLETNVVKKVIWRKPKMWDYTRKSLKWGNHNCNIAKVEGARSRYRRDGQKNRQTRRSLARPERGCDYPLNWVFKASSEQGIPPRGVYRASTNHTSTTLLNFIFFN